MENQKLLLLKSNGLPGFLEWKVSQQLFWPMSPSSGIGHRIGLEGHEPQAGIGSL
jgi:hypothetical protein